MNALDAQLERLGGDFTAALDDLPVCAVLLDAEGVIRWQNGRSREVSGDLVGSPFAGLVSPDDLASYEQTLTRIVGGGQPTEFALDLRNADGEIVPTEISSASIRDGSTVVGIFGLGRQLPEAGGRPPRTTRSSEKTGLTDRQHQVLQLLAEGRSTEEIAAALGLSPTTVRNYVARILATLGVHTRLQAVLAARRRGLV
jgi:PAS domain S-box-containing protein